MDSVARAGPDHSQEPGTLPWSPVWVAEVETAGSAAGNPGSCMGYLARRQWFNLLYHNTSLRLQGVGGCLYPNKCFISSLEPRGRATVPWSSKPLELGQPTQGGPGKSQGWVTSPQCPPTLSFLRSRPLLLFCFNSGH